MSSRLFLVKDKLYRLMQEQLRHKVKFNLMKYDTRVQAWRDRLVDCNSHNLDNAWQWVKGLSTGGSTNTLAALKLALTDPQCRAIYLLTDGRPDQPPSSILAQVHLLNPVPIHTISFNCADTEANEFLCKLAADTNARFHYFSEDGYDVNGPKPFESEDLRLLREEIEKGLKDLKKVALLRNECSQLDWYGSNAGRCSNSYKDYLVSSASRDIPRVVPSETRPSVGETRTSQLRLNMRKQSGDWMMRETREYLARNPEDYRKPRGRGRTKKRRTAKKDIDDRDMPVKKWLKKYGLAAQKLTILDALSPTLIPHTTKYVPILNKHILSKVFDQVFDQVIQGQIIPTLYPTHPNTYIPILDNHILSKVFDQVLPLAHTSGSNRDEVQLVNPQAVNLKAYEIKLQSAIDLLTRKLDELVYFGLSDQERVKYPEEKVPSFLQHRESMMKDLEEQEWQVPQEDILALEREISQANTFMQQSMDLRTTSEQAAREIAEQQKRAREEMENKRFKTIMEKPAAAPAQPTPQGNKFRLRHHKVLARNEVDGFYYPGLVSKCINSRYVEVDFNDCERQAVSVRYVIPVEGARPCPTLKVGDYVLVRTPVPREVEDDVIADGACCYVPGIVQVVPLRKSPATRCYTILRFNGKKIGTNIPSCLCRKLDELVYFGLSDQERVK
ncbi:predicted protein [Nematostella vectensis]|uniref:VWFA domain-containing protein n=1 Tax=Nematostella vectensis TaxID=45351 RepID=A7T6S8_NEMVE|nr:predicted protein [Nematostella vectensis]|eukprot:XP_001620427.1 hypothetical protein NEMVEDRAFT_v1g248787 [Nematostella vectensis]